MLTETVNVPAFKPMADRAHFAQATKAGGLLFCSGSIGFDMENGGVPDDLATEFRNAFGMIAFLLEQAGLDFSDVVEMTSYLVDFANTAPTFTAVRDEFLNPPWGAWTAIEVAGFAVPGAHVEIRGVAQLR